MRMICFSLFLIMPLWSLTAQMPDNWQEMGSVESLYAVYPDRMAALFEHLNIEQPGMEAVRSAVEKQHWIQACELLLAYYQKEGKHSYLYRSVPLYSSQRVPVADSILMDYHTYYEQTARIPRDSVGSLDWTYDGPADDIEWAWGLNRHTHLITLLDAFVETGKQRYVEAIDRNIKDWVISSLPYPGEKSRTAMWRGLEVSFRVKAWARVFYGLLDEELFSPVTRLLILTSIPEHTHYLKSFHGGGNWLTMEMSALAMAAIAWPEFNTAKDWIEYSKDTMTTSLAEQVYPDGVQTELTAHYHNVALRNFEQFLAICEAGNIGLDPGFSEQLEKMWNYQAYSMRPAGTNPLNNDSDLRNYKSSIVDAANRYEREDWTFIATNGLSGKQPEVSSLGFPFAGQFILRSGYGKEDSWLFFDNGPWGSGHQHNDKLHISLSCHGNDYLVDSGRFAYRGAIADKFRPYGRSSHGHNVILIDGQGQAPGPRITKQPLPENSYSLTSDFSYASGSMDMYNNIADDIEHSRAVLQVDNFYLVLDHVATDRQRKIDVLWHWHPSCELTELGGKIKASYSTGDMVQLIPIGNLNWNIEMIKGQEKPEIQGWYSREYNRAEPNPTHIFSTELDSSTYFAWLLLPNDIDEGLVSAEISNMSEVGVQLELSLGGDSYSLFIPLRSASLVEVNRLDSND